MPPYINFKQRRMEMERIQAQNELENLKAQAIREQMSKDQALREAVQNLQLLPEDNVEPGDFAKKLIQVGAQSGDVETVTNAYKFLMTLEQAKQNAQIEQQKQNDLKAYRDAQLQIGKERNAISRTKGDVSKPGKLEPYMSRDTGELIYLDQKNPTHRALIESGMVAPYSDNAQLMNQFFSEKENNSSNSTSSPGGSRRFSPNAPEAPKGPLNINLGNDYRKK